MTDILRGETRQQIERLAVLTNALFYCTELVNEISYGDGQLSITIIIMATDLS